MNRKKAPAKSGAGSAKPMPLAPEAAFDDIVRMIEQSRHRAVQAVNAVLVDLYWQVGGFLASRIEADGWGKGTVEALSVYVQQRQPGIRGFSPQNLWRMRQFFETWRDRLKLSALLREVP